MPPTSILITGATGRIGANVAKRMDDLGHHVRALVPPNESQKTKLESLGIETIHGDLTPWMTSEWHAAKSTPFSI